MFHNKFVGINPGLYVLPIKDYKTLISKYKQNGNSFVLEHEGFMNATMMAITGSRTYEPIEASR